MLKQEYSFGKDLEIIKAERLRKNRTNVCNLTKTSKIKIYCKKRVHIITPAKNVTCYSKYLDNFFLKFFKLLSLS